MCPYQPSYHCARVPDLNKWEREVKLWEQKLMRMTVPPAYRNVSTLRTLERIYGGADTTPREDFYVRRFKRVQKQHILPTCMSQPCWYFTCVHQPCGYFRSVKQPCGYSPSMQQPGEYAHNVQQPCLYSTTVPQPCRHSPRRYGVAPFPKQNNIPAAHPVPFCENFLTCLCALNMDANVPPPCAQCFNSNGTKSPQEECKLLKGLLKEHPAGYRPGESTGKRKKKRSLTVLVREPLESIQYCAPNTSTRSRRRKRTKECKCSDQTNTSDAESDSSSSAESSTYDSDSSRARNRLHNFQIQMAQSSADVIPPARKRISGLEIARALQRKKTFELNAKLHKSNERATKSEHVFNDKAELKESAQQRAAKCTCAWHARNAASRFSKKRRMDSGLETDYSNAERW